MTDRRSLQRVAQALRVGGVAFALGGSGLLCALGLADRARDWDLTTDAPLDQVTAALDLAGLPWQYAPHGDPPFASAYRLNVAPGGGPEIDLMGRFAITTPEGTCRLPTIPGFEWAGVPVGSPEVWAVAYRLMERHPKADLLREYVLRNGANPAVMHLLLEQPLPTQLRAEAQSWLKA